MVFLCSLGEWRQIIIYTKCDLVMCFWLPLCFERSGHKMLQTTFTAVFATEHLWAEVNVNTKCDQGPRVKLFTVLDSPTNKESLVYPRAELSCCFKCREAFASSESCWLQGKEKSYRLSSITVRLDTLPQSALIILRVCCIRVLNKLHRRTSQIASQIMYYVYHSICIKRTTIL